MSARCLTVRLPSSPPLNSAVCRASDCSSWLYVRSEGGRRGGRFGPDRPLLRRFFDAEPGDIKGRQKEQGQQCRNKEAADNRVSHRSPENLWRDRDHAEGGG